MSFYGEPPKYFNADLHEDTRWKGIKVWPVPKGENAADEADYFIRSYERLKLLMAGQNKVHHELMFQRRELRCREIAEPHSLATWGYRIFRWLSDYGWSITRPAGGLVANVGLEWFLIYYFEWTEFLLAKLTGKTAELLGFGQSFALSVSNVFGFLGLSRSFLVDEIKTLTAASEIVSPTQTILGLILFFLLGLALRNRFRIK